MKNRVMLWTMLLFGLIYVGLGVMNYRFIINKVSIDPENVWNWGWIIAAVQLVYLFPLSFRTVGPQELGAVLLFGRPIYQVGSGLSFVPWLICSLRKESKLIIQIQIPGPPEMVDRSGNDEKGVDDGKVLPIRATTGSLDVVIADPEFSGEVALKARGEPLNNRMTLEPNLQIRFKIFDLIRFIQIVGSIEEAEIQLRDTSEGVIKAEFARRTPALIIAHWAKINEILKEKVQALVGDDPKTPTNNEGWGVKIDTAQMVDLDITRKVNESLRSVAASMIDYSKTVKDAEAEKEKKRLHGQGDADAAKSLLFAQAEGQAKLAETAKTEEGRIALALQTAARTAEKANYSIVPESGFMGAIAAAMETVRRTNPGKGDKKTEGSEKSEENK